MVYVSKASKTIQHGAIKLNVTMRGLTMMDEYTEVHIAKRLYEAVTGKPLGSANIEATNPADRAINLMVTFIVRTEIAKGLPFSWVTPASSDDELVKAYQNVFSLPKEVVEAWRDLAKEANKPPGDEDLFPSEQLSEEQKKILTLSESDAS